MSEDWVDLHHHSEFSLLDGFGSVEDHVKRAAELGHPAVAFTEHGTARGFVAHREACKEHGVKPIYGLEFYVTQDHTVRGLTEEQKASVTAGKKGNAAREAAKDLEHALGITERRHLVLIAENDIGLRNLMLLNNLANTDGFYYKPRIDLDLLERHAEGLWGSSACLGGVLAQSWLRGDMDRLLEDAERLQQILDGRFSLEIQPHPIDEQREWNRVAHRLSSTLGIPLIGVNDSHYVVAKDESTHDTLIALGRGEMKFDPERSPAYVPESFALKSQVDFVEAFERNGHDLPTSVVIAAAERAAMIADRCTAKLDDPVSVYLPDMSAGTPETPDDLLADLCLEGWEIRGLDKLGLADLRTYTRRLNHELRVIRDLKFANYFLVLHDMLAWAREQEILIGPGRGSSAGSLVCHLLRFTALDPIKHGLLFERFLTPGRPDWPDIDVDVEKERRVEVFEYLRRRWGDECVAQIGTLSRMRGRSALRDVARVHGIPIGEVESVATAIVSSVVRDDDDGSIAEALVDSAELQAFADRHPDMMREALALEGHVRHVGIHAAGVIVSPFPLADRLPLERRTVKSSNESKVVIGYDMRDVERAGFVKYDILGLKTLSVIGDCLRIHREMTGEELDPEQIPLDDPDVLAAFTNHDFDGVFQFDSPSARAACSGVTFRSFSDVVALNAINRPGPANSGLADEWRARNAGHTTRAGHLIVERVCEDAHGVIIYQEHIIRLLQELAGFSPEKAGKVRKAIAKSKGVRAVEEFEDDFVAGAVHSGMTEPDARRLLGQIGQFGRYGFNKSHAAAYSQIGVWCMWLKLYAPVAFFAALLRHEADVGQVGRYVRAAARMGIRISPPDINTSEATWSVNGSGLLAGLSGVKGVGERATEELLANAPYTSLGDLYARVNRAVVNKGVLRQLARAGALRAIVPNPRWLDENVDKLVKWIDKSKGWVTKVDDAVEAGAADPTWDGEDAWAHQIAVGAHGDGRYPMGVLRVLDEDILREDWGHLGAPEDGDLLRGVVSSCKVGSSGKDKYASLEIEDGDGNKARLRFNGAAYEANRAVIKEGVGALVAARIGVDERGSVRCVRLWNLLELRDAWRVGTWPAEANELSIRHHPCKRLTGPGFATTGGTREVMVVNVHAVRARSSGKRMAFVHLDPGPGNGRAMRAVVFPDTWEKLEDGLWYGDHLKVTVDPPDSRGAGVIRKVALL